MSHWWTFLTKNSLYYLLHNIQQHVILNTYYLILNFYVFIDWNLWPFPARSANSFMNIYGFIDDYFWPQKSAKRKTFMTHWWTFLTKKTDIQQHVILNTYYLILNYFYDFIDDHFWQKSHESPESIQNTLLKHSGNSWPYIQLIKLSNTRLLKLRNNATCCTRNNQFQHT